MSKLGKVEQNRNTLRVRVGGKYLEVMYDTNNVFVFARVLSIEAVDNPIDDSNEGAWFNNITKAIKYLKAHFGIETFNNLTN